MSTAFILLALGAATGFTIGNSFSWFAILISSAALAALSAAVLHFAGFNGLSGIAIIATCLTVHQLAFVMGVALARRASEEPKKSRERHDKLPKQGFGPIYISLMINSTTNQAKMAKPTLLTKTVRTKMPQPAIQTAV
jgi:hypothetical protein